MSNIALPSDIDTVDTLDGFRRTLGVDRWAHPGEARCEPGLVGGNPAEATYSIKVAKNHTKRKINIKK